MNEIALTARPSLAPHARLQADRTGKDVLLYPEGILELNETAKAILAHCDGRTTVEKLIAALAEDYEIDAGEMQADVLEYLRDLQQRRLLVLC